MDTHNLTTHELPLVSVITPTLNCVGTLRDTLLSVREQTYPAIQHIVVDGGSTDGTVDLLEEAATNGVIWISQPDEGMYDAINKGIKLSEGDVVAYLNSDDRYFPYSVELAVRELQENPDVGFVYADLLNLDKSRSKGAIYFYPPFRKGVLHRGMLVGQPTVFLRRAILEEVGGFDASFKLAGDLDCLARIAERSPGKHIDEVLAVEGEHPTRLSAVPELDADRIRERQRILSRYQRVGQPPLIIRVYDSVRGSFWYRYSAIRLILTLLFARSSQPGRRWGGFLGYARDLYEINILAMVAALVPFVGRRFKESVSAGD